MLCVVYKSPKKAQTYLYVLKRDDFSAVPEALMKTFGTPELVTVINLAKRVNMGQADVIKLKQSLTEQGFYLQLPPPVEDMLKEHKNKMGSANS
ncbi:YcgL domain-containing protein [Thalassotalea aquiviva]|uniref:YcgL domain-containing protein n=1 Tax=Thalassotalea aquiviva TaxID=3242415 RepID=UPI003529EAFD